MKKKLSQVKFLVFKIALKITSLILPLKENKVLILSEVRANLGGNLEYAYEYIKDLDYEIKIILKADRSIRKSIKENIELIINLSNSKYILLDDASRAVSLMTVRKGQKVCQLWHGSGAFKTFGYSRNDRNVKKEGDIWHSKYTNAIVSSEEIRKCYAEGFGIPIEKIKATGSPRTDIFFDKEHQESTKKELYEKYPYLKDKKVILFAPTYKGESVKKATYDYDSIDYQKLYEELKDDYIFIFKWHPAIYWNIGDSLFEQIKHYGDFFYDFSQERDINDMLLVTDVLITDYSSVIFDYALLKKPIVYFVPDLYNYLVGRGLYFPFKDYVYGPIARNTEQLIKSIKNAKLEKSLYEEFMKKFMSACDGKATEKTMKWILGSK